MTRAKGGGKACPELLENELRECVKECPVESPNKGDEEEAQHDDAEGELQGVAVLEDVSETYCSIEQELWTACSVECLQERYLDPACKKEAEVSVGIKMFRVLFFNLILSMMSCLACLVGEGMVFQHS